MTAMTVASAWLLLLAMMVVMTAVAVADDDAAGGERDGRSGTTVLADIAQELIARSGTSSQVLSLNLTNLVILLVLKGLLVAAAMWGTKGGAEGAGAGWQRSRSGQSPLPLPALPSAATFFSEPELALLISYLMGDSGSGDGSGDSCLLRVACEEPKKAREYIAAGTMAIKAAKILDKVVPVNPKYARLLDEMTAAAQHGAADDEGPAACRRRYDCGHGRRNHNGV